MVLKLLTLKYNIEKHIEVLEKKCPLSPMIAESIQILIDMDASESDMHSWANNQRTFIRDIEKEIQLIEQTKEAV